MLTPDWLKLDILKDGKVMCAGFVCDALKDEDLEEVHWRMNVIMDEIEYRRCEGRWLNLKIFNALDDMKDSLNRGDASLDNWASTIVEWEAYYGANDAVRIDVTSAANRSNRDIEPVLSKPKNHRKASDGKFGNRN